MMSWSTSLMRECDTALDDNRALAERQTEIVEGIELQREIRLDLHAAMAHLAHAGRLKDHYLAVQRSQELDSL